MPDASITIAGQGTLVTTDSPGQVWRVGYAPNPWAWTPWAYADHGTFPGRWDDPAGLFRTLYATTELTTALLEVLARFRPDPHVNAAIALISAEPDDDELYPTVPAGTVDPRWLEPRLVGTATLSGRYAAVTQPGSLAALRRRFLPLALQLGLPDLDAATLKMAEPRTLTQAVAGWLHDLHHDRRPLLHGVRFDSRHGDGLTMWAVFEQPEDAATSSQLSHLSAASLPRDHPALREAFRLHHLTWLA